METQTSYQASTPEQTVLRIMRKLTPERVAALVDFARFLEYRAAEGVDDYRTATDEVGDPDQRWDELLARPEAREVMRQMAREARADYGAGRAT